MIHTGSSAYRDFVAGEPGARVGEVVGLARCGVGMGCPDQSRIPQVVQASVRDAPGRESPDAEHVSVRRAEQEAASPDDGELVLTGHGVAARKLRIGRSLAGESQCDQEVARRMHHIAAHEPELDVEEVDELLLETFSVGDQPPHRGQDGRP